MLDTKGEIRGTAIAWRHCRWQKFFLTRWLRPLLLKAWLESRKACQVPGALHLTY